MKQDPKRIYIIFAIWVILFVSVVFLLIFYFFSFDNKNTLTVAFLDIGQGDAIFIETPNKTQMLIDGGPDKEVLSELSKFMKFYDRKIDIVLATHTDKDHIGGLPVVLDRFEVNTVIQSGTVSDTMIYDSFQNYIDKEGASNILGVTGTRILLDEKRNIYADILFPNRDVSNWNPNDGSIILKLVYGETSFLLTGDAPDRIENYLLVQNDIDLRADVLKLGHHGSNTSSGFDFLKEVDPKYGVVSAGCDNSYGHPHKDVLSRLSLNKITAIGTCENGTIIFKTNGRDLILKR